MPLIPVKYASPPRAEPARKNVTAAIAAKARVLAAEDLHRDPRMTP